ncbi:hypothetical protein GNP81_13215 [Aliivibrio fischeri]|uniref:hypothetical protein n=1 Tax=Aliivibrio fischeri TaxID=668 RepID=UPI0012D96FA6|nr:hypothetical protein [Aliivibrio fischeri]MUK61498.1 hypothetical protein [Aliivibrio fischeri]MUL22231.1 hypothetical protein [Aliivibrio fischeri]MUL25554.1 hypothetical protein [Aliivibrio fischeri]
MSSSKYLAAILLAPVIPFLFYFSHHEVSFSEKQVDWGAFGSYMGGVVGPIVAAITLLFLIDSYQRSSKQGALQTFIQSLTAHVEYATNYKTQYSSSYTGHKYLNWLWDVVADSSEQNLIERIEKNYGEIQPLVNNIKLIISVIEQDSSFNDLEKKYYIQHVYSRLSSVEMKLFLASSLVDAESKRILKNYDSLAGLVVSRPKTEDWLINKFDIHIKT